MYRFPILFLIISACTALLFTSCAVQTVKGYDAVPTAIQQYHATYFSDPETDYVYKAHISVYGKDFGGIFIVKKINDTTHRIAFTTEFGNKLFDFEITDDSFKVNFILEEFDRKIVVNTLKKDFMLLLKMNHEVMAQYENSKTTVYKSKDEKRYNYLFTDKATGSLKKLVNATKSKEKTVITYTPESEKLADSIIIDHKNIKLRIALEYINN
ncbi:hypothetical protein [Flavobacterium rhizosphaerae]|uniref:Lipoprotein n=1 Tax=Flavobacterium rhizosphaerae TaxID=3163298 RepID=A0ABW8YX63_9FLAO